MDGKTYYYLLDEKHILHICSDGMTRCKKDSRDFIEVYDNELKLYELCAACQLPDKKATFETKAELIEGE